ncbi:MAG TPA: magnesium-translocating P-type ATPase [Methylophilaceae bacterium]|nr:magnesium-translocating P-type ATPase [Methylophilaceae bacterium]
MPDFSFNLSGQWWQTPLPGLLQKLESTVQGLPQKSVSGRLVSCGPNIVEPRFQRPLLLQFLSRFKSPLVLLLLAASLISAFTADLVSFSMLIFMVILSVSLDFFQEYRAEQTADALRRSVAVRASVFRDCVLADIHVEQLVPGDVVLLRAGDLVPADGRIIEADDFFVNQALLTGEAYPVEKHAGELQQPASDYSEAANALFAGSTVISGSARVLICVTGSRTVLGGLAGSLRRAPPPTAFEKSTYQFGMLIVRLTFFLVIFVLFVNLLHHRPGLETFMFALALAVGLTPELLPMVVTVTLSRGALRMSRRHVIVKRLAAIHNLGAMDVLCTDKTGTLTEARIRLERHLDAAGNESEQVLLWAYLNSYFETGLKSPLDEAILNHQALDVSGWRKIDEVPFDFERRRVSVLLQHEASRFLVVKGAPEDVLRLCTHYELSLGKTAAVDAGRKAALGEQALALARQGFRVLGIAWRQVEPERSQALVGDESELVFAGFAAFLDPPKADAAEALRQLKHSGIDIKVVTGDNEQVTAHLCAQLGLEVRGIVTGSQIAQMDDTALQASVDSVNLFCRVTPGLKSRVLLALRQRGHTVGYLGDGINDASALHVADVSISVDTAADVAKEAAELILLRHDLNVLHEGVVEGRRTQGNIMKYVMMGTSSNFGNMASMAGASLFLPFLPMLPLQILLNNLLYDLSEVALPFDRVDPEYLSRPRKWDMRFIRNFMLVLGPVSSLFDFLTFYLMLTVLHASETLFRTGWFVESIATQILVIFVIRTRRNPLKSRPDTRLIVSSVLLVALALLLPYCPLGAYFQLTPPPSGFLVALLGMVAAYLLIVEWVKRQFYHWHAG